MAATVLANGMFIFSRFNCPVLCVTLTFQFNLTGPIESNKYMHFQRFTRIKI